MATGKECEEIYQKMKILNKRNKTDEWESPKSSCRVVLGNIDGNNDATMEIQALNKIIELTGKTGVSISEGVHGKQVQINCYNNNGVNIKQRCKAGQTSQYNRAATYLNTPAQCQQLIDFVKKGAMKYWSVELK